MVKNLIIGILVLALVIVLAVWVGGNNGELNTENETGAEMMEGESTDDNTASTSETMMAESAVVTYTNDGFSPSNVVINVGDTVTFMNESDHEMWVASATHPSHEAYSQTTLSDHCPDETGTAFDQCEGVDTGESWSFMFDQAGDWKYHNHLESSATGSITVQ